MNHSIELGSINEEYLMEPSANKTFFRSLNNSIIVSQVGSVVHIPCQVHLIGDEMVKLMLAAALHLKVIGPIISLIVVHRTKKVSWIRRKDYHLLTVGLTTYSSDERFSVIHYDETEVNN